MRLKVRIIAVGSIKESYLKEGIEHFMQALNRRWDVVIQELPETRVSDGASEAEIHKAVTKDSEGILSAIHPSERVILLDSKGAMLTSRELRNRIRNLSEDGHVPLVMVIGGSHGVNREMFRQVAFSLSFSRMTFPHQLMRLVLLEQIYRLMSS